MTHEDGKVSTKGGLSWIFSFNGEVTKCLSGTSRRPKSCACSLVRPLRNIDVRRHRYCRLRISGRRILSKCECVCVVCHSVPCLGLCLDSSTGVLLSLVFVCGVLDRIGTWVGYREVYSHLVPYVVSVMPMVVLYQRVSPTQIRRYVWFVYYLYGPDSGDGGGGCVFVCERHCIVDVTTGSDSYSGYVLGEGSCGFTSGTRCLLCEYVVPSRVLHYRRSV